MSGPDDVELANDLVGVASARLLAAGVSRGDRLGAMRLLGILATVADAERRVRRPLTDVALEFALPPGLAQEWAGHLEQVGVIRREGTTTLLAALEPMHSSPLRLQDFLEAAAELDEQRRHRPVRLLRPVGAALAAAAVVAAVLLAPGVVRERTTTASSGGDGQPAPTTTEVLPGAARPATPAGTVPVTARSTATTAAPAAGPVQHQPTTPTTTPGPVPCPAGVPLLQVLGSTPDAGGNLAVDGVATNPTGADVRVDSFTVHATVGGQDISAAGTDRPLVVPAHSSVLWQARLPVVAPAGTPVQATLGHWAWNTPTVPSTCPSP